MHPFSPAHKRRWLLLASLFLLGPQIAFADSIPEAWPFDSEWTATGARVRITAPSLSKHPSVGWVKAWSADALSIERDSDRSIQSIPVPAIKTLEASQGKKGHAVTGAAFGFLVGGIVGVGLGQAVMNSGEYDDYAAMGAGLAAWAGTAVAGAILGASIGSFTKTERWKRVPATRDGS